MEPNEIAIQGAWALAQMMLDMATLLSPLFALAVIGGAVVVIVSVICAVLDKAHSRGDTGKGE